uniref:Uncharacterized protein n=1 Tax=Oryza brachyantha TaxID=4533 RepID=J3L0V0_ORYBR
MERKAAHFSSHDPWQQLNHCGHFIQRSAKGCKIVATEKQQANVSEPNVKTDLWSLS